MQHRVLLGLLLVCSTCVTTIAQPTAPEMIWNRTFGDFGFEKSNAITPTSDGGFILVHMSSSYGAGDFDRYVVKTDSDGILLWGFTYGGYDWDETWAVWECADAGLVMVGCTQSFGAGGWDGYVSKIDAVGNELWSRTYGSDGGDCFYDGVATADGGCAFAGIYGTYGYGSGDFYLVRADSEGDTLWTRTYGGYSGERAWAMAGTADGGFVLAGYSETYTAGGQDVYVVKTDSAGNAEWTRSVGGSGEEQARDIKQTADGGYIVAGFTVSPINGNKDLLLARLSAAGGVFWSRTYGGAGTDWAYTVIVDNDGGFIAGGTTDSYGAGFYDAWLIKTDSLGNLLWSQTYGGGATDEFSNMISCSDGYVAIGATQSWGAGGWDFWMVRLRNTISPVSPLACGITTEYDLHPNYPNPFNASTRIVFNLAQAGRSRIEVYNALGQTVATPVDAVLPAGSHAVSFDAANLPSGTYFYRLHAGTFTDTRSMILLK